jgi:hypothetical protein
VCHLIFSSPCQRQCELLSSLGVCRRLTFHILIFSSETPRGILYIIWSQSWDFVDCQKIIVGFCALFEVNHGILCIFGRSSWLFSKDVICLLLSIHPGKYSFICRLLSIHPVEYSFIFLLLSIHPSPAGEYSYISLLLTWFSIWHLKLIENGGVTHNFESGLPKNHFNSNFWAKDFDVIFIS